MIEALDHVNLRTVQLNAMISWYEQVLHLRSGDRPDFPFAGAWLYAGERALVHLVEVDEAPPKSEDLTLEHAAFRASGLADFIDRLKANGSVFRLARVPGVPLVQVNVWDPDGNHLHIDFDAAEAEGYELEDFQQSRLTP